MSIALKAYGFGTASLAPLVGAAFAFHPRGRRRLAERFGSWEEISDSPIWLHGASVGEVQGLAPLIGPLKKSFPGNSILLTSTSPTGIEQHIGADEVRLLPFDASWCLRSALRKVKPHAVVVSETELWPLFFYELSKRKIPLFIINARISDFTEKRYKLIKSLITPVLPAISGVGAVSDTDRQRFINLGVDERLITITGNTKYDRHPSVTDAEQKRFIRSTLFAEENSAPILVLGSIHPGEERFWLEAINYKRRKGQQINIVLVPRHVEKIQSFQQQLESFGMKFTHWDPVKPVEDKSTDTVLVGQTGFLEKIYSCADMAFVGGSLVDLGGHNPLEAVAYGVPVAMGPSLNNIKDISAELISYDSLAVINSLAQAKVFIEDVSSRTKVPRRESPLSEQSATDRTIEMLIGNLAG